MTSLASEAQTQLDDANSAKNIRDMAIAGAVGIYAVNLLDAWLLKSNIIKNYDQLEVSAVPNGKGLAVAVRF